MAKLSEFVGNGLPEAAVGDRGDHLSLVGTARDANRTPAEQVLIAELTVRDSPRLDGEDDEHIRRLLDAEDQLPPILVHRPTKVVIDGVHRLRAAQLRGATRIAATFVDCPWSEVFVIAVRVNVTYGLQLSLADRKAAASRILMSHPQWSDRAVAAATGLAHKTVGKIRRGLDGGSRGTDVRTGRDGRVRPFTHHRRAIAEEIINRHPDYSLRKLAEAAGISVSTAHDVRRKMRLSTTVPGSGTGEDPDERPDGEPCDDGQGNRKRSGRRAPDGPHAWVLQRLRADPSLRFKSAGRMLLQVLGIHALVEDDWRRLADTVPVHWASAVAGLAREAASAWEEFAARLDETALSQPVDPRKTVRSGKSPGAPVRLPCGDGGNRVRCAQRSLARGSK